MTSCFLILNEKCTTQAQQLHNTPSHGGGPHTGTHPYVGGYCEVIVPV
jgi:hypothetical protein